MLLLVLYEDKSTTWQAKQLGAYYILLQTCNQLEEHFFGIEVAGCRSNLVCANVWSYCPSRRSKMNLLRLHHKHQRLFCGLERALRLDAKRIPSSADVLLNFENSIASGCHLPLLSLQLYAMLRADHKGHPWSVLCGLTRYPESVGCHFDLPYGFMVCGGHATTSEITWAILRSVSSRVNVYLVLL